MGRIGLAVVVILSFSLAPLVAGAQQAEKCIGSGTSEMRPLSLRRSGSNPCGRACVILAM
jgi:hypothetical protein